ncbi:MAG: hypothetical protein CVV64_14345 [Candidatus Wallbacteria bacterium HGW-Wallbacteria-1]|jgi:anti-anti-sigma factor|uniref:STAS domain-containing protein n=1 Tax=Candidatus Wallbacteria bacterium HGW-Wallbacteria-1 TaxID=2013854 RepID=A0A2N1PM94_9BACT|nr:MAG: hypothetical protein CVV64_14345 [Candidatus Wallbacteria bacterium HGW-Wallbacteria-1]
MSSERLTIGSSAFSNVIILDLRGSLDIYTVSRLKAAIELLSTRSGCDDIVVDCRSLESIDKAGIDYLAATAREFGDNKTLAAAGLDEEKVNPRLLTYLAAHVQLFKNDADALASLLGRQKEYGGGPSDSLLQFNRFLYLFDDNGMWSMPVELESFDEECLYIKPLSILPANIVPTAKMKLRLLSPEGVMVVSTYLNEIRQQDNWTILVLGRPVGSGSVLMRSHERFNIRIIIEYNTFNALASGGSQTKMLSGVSRNISSGGILLETKHPVDEDSYIGMKFRLGKAKVNLAMGVVIRKISLETDESGKPLFSLGVKFTAIHPEDRLTIHSHIMSMRSSGQCQVV